MIADIANHTETQDLMRGWSRQIFLLTNTLGLTYLLSLRNLNIWLYCIGSSVSKISYYILSDIPFYIWKIGYGEPITLFVICLSLAAFKNSYWKIGLFLFIMSLVNLFMDYRSLAALTLILALFAWIKRTKVSKIELRSFKFYLIALFAISCFTLVYIQSERLPLNLLQAQEGVSTVDRRSQSNSGRLSSLSIAIKAISQSPLIGYGSWPKNSDLAREYYSLSYSKESSFYQNKDYNNLVIPSHSQILQSWIEGGILGMTFFMTLIISLTTSIKKLIFSPYTPTMTLCFFILSSALIDAFISPFGGFVRLSIALAIAAICIVESSSREALSHRINTTSKP
jgi:O-antigen ligase